MRRATTDNTGSGGATRSGIRLFDSGAGSTNVSDGASADYAAYTHYSTFYKNEANITTKPQSTTPFKSGSVAAKDGEWLHFDYVPGEADVREGSAVVIGRLCVIGCNLKEDALRDLFTK